MSRVRKEVKRFKRRVERQFRRTSKRVERQIRREDTLKIALAVVGGALVGAFLIPLLLALPAGAALSAVVGVEAAAAQGILRKRAADATARAIRKEAQRKALLIKEEVREAIEVEEIQTGRIVSSQEAGFAAAGVTQEGSAQEVILQTLMDSIFQQELILAAAGRGEQELLAQARAQGRSIKKAARGQTIETGIRVAGSIVSAGVTSGFPGATSGSSTLLGVGKIS